MVTSILLTKNELEKLGHEVIVFAPAPAKGEKREEGVYYFRSVRFKKYQGYRVPIFPTNKNEILEKLDVDVIHTHGLFFMGLRSMFAGRTLKKPVVATFHTMVSDAIRYYNFTPIPDEIADKLMWIYVRRLLQRSEAVIAPTEAIKKELMTYASKMRRIEVIPTGVDCDRFNPNVDASEIKRKYGLEGRKVILHLGRIAREKNLELVLQGFVLLAKKRSDIRLLIVGDGPAKDYYIELAKKLGINESVVFTGFVPDTDLPRYYAACDVFTLASKFETQGLVILEAMATGKPVTGINYRAVAEIIREGKDGFLFNENPESWENAIIASLDAPDDIHRTVVKRASEFSNTKSTKRLVEIYKFAVEAKQARLQGKVH